MVDVGGGVGRLLAAILTATPTAHGVLYDLPQAVAEAPALLRQHAIADRVRVEEGSFFDGVPAGGDIYVLKMIIHDWPEDQAIEILRNVRAAAEVGTTLLLIETVLSDHNRDHVGNWTNLEMLLMPPIPQAHRPAPDRAPAAARARRSMQLLPTSGIAW